jgi:hypothetical protein
VCSESVLDETQSRIPPMTLIETFNKIFPLLNILLIFDLQPFNRIKYVAPLELLFFEIVVSINITPPLGLEFVKSVTLGDG